MSDKKKYFWDGHQVGKNNIEYSVHRIGDDIHVSADDAEDPINGASSSAVFNFDPDTKELQVKEGTLDLHPEHAKLGVGQAMRRVAIARYGAHY